MASSPDLRTRDRLILVTGGAGYIGSVLVGQLLAEGYSVRVLDNLTYGGMSLLSYLPNPRFKLIVGDIGKAADVERALENSWAVVHLAAIVGDPSCSRNPELAVRVNKEGSEQVAEKAMRLKVQRFVFASTCSNYGRMADSDGYVDETSPLRPVSLYAELKVGFEKFLLSKMSGGFSPVCLRFATAYGLSPRPRFDLTVNEFAKELALGRTLEVFGEQFWRPYCHTTDLARGIRLALEAPTEQMAGKVYNVGDTSENYQKRTLVELIQHELGGKSGTVSYVQKSEDPRDYRVRFEKIKTEMGFAVKNRVADGIREIVNAVQTGIIRDPDAAMYSNV